MLKIKTIKSASKRFKKVSLGNFKRKQANTRHILTKKSSKRKRKLRKKLFVLKKEINFIRNCIPY